MGSSFIDKFGYRRQRANPISRTGVFPYTGEQIDQPAKDPLTGKPIYKINPLTGRPEIDPKTGKPVPQMQFGLEPKKLYPVLRGPEELFNKDAIDSFNGLPIRIGHLMLGKIKGSNDLKSVDEEPVDGCIYNVRPSLDEPGYLIAEFCIYTDRMKDILKDGKVKELSLGYTCIYEAEEGVYEGIPYMFKQTNLRGNHLALVKHGRCGSSVCVCDEAVVTFDSLPEGITLMEDNKKEETKIDRAKKLAAAIKGGDEQLAQDCLDFADFPPEVRKEAFEFIKNKNGKKEEVKEESKVEDKATKTAKDADVPPPPPDKAPPAESPAPETAAASAPAPAPGPEATPPPPTDVPSPKDGENPAEAQDKDCKDKAPKPVCDKCGCSPCECGKAEVKEEVKKEVKTEDKAAKDCGTGVTDPSIPTPAAAVQAPADGEKKEETPAQDKAPNAEKLSDKPANAVVKETEPEKPADTNLTDGASTLGPEKTPSIGKEAFGKGKEKTPKVAQDEYAAFVAEYTAAQALAEKLRPFIKETFDSAPMREIDVARFAAKHIDNLAFVQDEASDEMVITAVRGYVAAIAMDAAPKAEVFEDVVKTPAEVITQDAAPVAPAVSTSAKDLAAFLAG